MNQSPAEWTQEQAEAIVKSLTRYTRVVRSIKISLGLVALLLIAALLFYPLFRKQVGGVRISLVSSSSKEPATPTTMNNARFQGIDGDGQPYTLISRAVMEVEQGKVAMEAPSGEILLKNGQKLGVKSEKGLFEKSEQKLELNGNVELTTDQGYVFTTQTMLVEVANKTAATSAEVHGKGPLGTLQAYGGAMMEGTSQQLIFEGPVFVTLNMKSKEAQEKPQ